jgi:gliding motility-associated-like protein
MRNYIYRLFTSLIFLINLLHVNAQTSFRRSYDIASFDLAGGMVQNPSGNFVMAGTNTTFLPLYGNIMEINSIGNIVWANRYVGGIATSITDIKNANGGGYIVCGTTDPGGFLMRIDNSGNVIWSRRYQLPDFPGKPSDEYFNAVIQTSDGGFLAAGGVNYFWDGVSPGTVDTASPFAVKVDATGNIQWSRVWTISVTNPDEHYFNDVTETSNGFIFVGISSEGSGTLQGNPPSDYPRNALIVKTNKTTGATTYINRFGAGNTSGQGLQCIITLSNGDALISGYDDIHAPYARISGTSTSFSQVSGRRINGATFPVKNYAVNDIAENSDGNYSFISTYLAGLIPVPTSAILKINASTGAVMIDRSYGTTGGLATILPEGGLATDQGYYYTMTDQQVGGFNYQIVRTDNLGNMNVGGTGCAPSSTNATTSNYTFTAQAVTNSQFANLATTNTFTPTVQSITPTNILHCLNVVCTPPAQPNLLFAVPMPFCVGSCTTVTVDNPQPGVNYLWYTVPSGGTPFATGTSQNLCPTTTTTYYVAAEDASNPGCESARTPVTINVSTLSAAPSSASASPNPICAGQSTTLTVNGGSLGTGATWNWYSGSCGGTPVGTGSSITVSPSSTTTYFVHAQGDCNTTTCVSVTVQVNPLPATPTGSASPNPICQGQSTTINATSSGSTSIQVWDASVGGNLLGTVPLSVNPSSTTTYYLVALNGTCAHAGARVPVTVTVNPAPATPTVSATNTTICQGQNTTINASGSGAQFFNVYTAMVGGTLLGTTPLVVTPSATTTYYVEAVSAQGCANLGGRVPITITVNPAPATPTVSATNTTICEGQSTTINASGSGAANFEVYTASTGGTLLGNTPLTVNPTVTTTYYVQAVSAQGCSNLGGRVPITITVNPAPSNPTVNATNQTICEGQSTTINASGQGANTFGVYTASVGGTFLGNAPLTVNPTTTTTYYVEAVSANGCTNLGGRVPITITVIPIANPSWTSPGATCEAAGTINLDALITGTPGGTWSGTGVTGNIFDPTGLAGQTVSITYTVGSAPCQQNSTQTIQITQNVSAAWTQPNPICENAAPINLNTLITGNSGGTWSGTGVTGNTFNPAGNVGTNTVTYTVGVPPCQDIVAHNITVLASPADPTVSASANTVCAGDPVTINATGSVGSTFNVYTTSTGGMAVGTTPYTFNATSTITYYVEATNANGCINLGGRQPVTITVNPLPNADAGLDQLICPSSSTTLTASGGGNYLWNTTETTASITVTPSNNITVYYVTVTDPVTGCEASDSVVVTINTSALTLQANNDSTQIENVQIAVINATTNDNGNFTSVSIIAGPNNGTASINGTVVSYTPNSGYEGTDTLVYVVCDALCNNYCDTATIIIRVIKEIVLVIPDGFSPNGDGINDEFVILGIEKYPENELYIYNRWGGLVYSAKPYQNNWKGESNTTTLKLVGDEVVDGTYFYILKLNAEEKGKNGYIELRRK